jgi:hypothetical protein
MKHPSFWTKGDLHQHLRHALDLELWTIPLYLTALYSIKGLKDLKSQDYPDAAKLIYSVAVQEMLHLELVCNISNALGWSPEFHAPVYDENKGIPFIHPDKDFLPKELHGYLVRPQALNEQSLKLFCAIELPHPKRRIVFEKGKTYESISEMYEALKMGIVKLWDECYVGDTLNIKQKESFREYHNTHGRHHGFSQVVNSPEAALKAIEAIIDQGEGADAARVPADFRPPVPAEGMEYDLGWYKGHLSHYQKFRILLHHHHKLPEVYSEYGWKNSIAQQEMESSFKDLLTEMKMNFNSDGREMSGSFWKSMFAFSNSIIAGWESGSCPVFS